MTAQLNSNQELVSYIGMEVNALTKQGYTPDQTKHIIVGQMMELIMQTIAVDEDKQLNLYALMPLFVAFKFLVDSEISRKQADAYIPLIQEDIKKLETISSYIGHRIEVIRSMHTEET